MSRTIKVCAVEQRLTAAQLLEVDLLLADPAKWPKTVFEGWKLPAGTPMGTMRTWGAVQMGLAWFRDHGIPCDKGKMQRHYELHVPILPLNPDDFVVRGIADTPHPTGPAAVEKRVVPTNPTAYIELYQKGIEVGTRALDLLLARVEAMVAHGDIPPTDLLMQMGNLGAKLATSQAGIVSRGFDLARQKEEEMEGFRSGSAPEVESLRFGDYRIHVIEGEARAVVDRGRADRRKYNEKARQDGSPTLPA